MPGILNPLLMPFTGSDGSVGDWKEVKKEGVRAEFNLGTRTLLFYDCFCGTDFFACATFSAFIQIDRINIITFIDGI